MHKDNLVARSGQVIFLTLPESNTLVNDLPLFHFLREACFRSL